MNFVILKKFTIVKHGTTFDRVVAIMNDGAFLPGSRRTAVREKQEFRPVSRGTYVAQNLSYYGALAAFSSVMYEHNQRGETGVSLPVVLQIELQEDCEILADEDYLKPPEGADQDYEFSDQELLEGAKHTWHNFETGVIPNREIPISWIKKIEYPLLRSLEQINQKQKFFDMIDQDTWVMVLAYWQTKTQTTKKEFDEMIKEFKRNRKYRQCFTNIERFSSTTLGQIQSADVIGNTSRFEWYSKDLWVDIPRKMHELGLNYVS
jgi:hypothetical protein